MKKKKTLCLKLRPSTEKVVVDARKLHGRRVIRVVSSQTLDGGVKVKEKRTLSVVANHTLNPKEGCSANPSRNWQHMVEAGGGIQDHMACRELHVMRPVGIFDNQFTAVILIRVIEEKRRGEVGTNTVTGPGYLSNSIIDVSTERVPTLVAIEKRRKYFRWQSSRNK